MSAGVAVDSGFGFGSTILIVDCTGANVVFGFGLGTTKLKKNLNLSYSRKIMFPYLVHQFYNINL